jgi:hypothetical protein
MENEDFDKDEIDRIEMTIVYILGQLDCLVAKGIVLREDGADRLSDLGKEVYAHLKETGFKPTEAEMSAATEVFRSSRTNED